MTTSSTNWIHIGIEIAHLSSKKRKWRVVGRASSIGDWLLELVGDEGKQRYLSQHQADRYWINAKYLTTPSKETP
tara:strand:- start:1117 stop:1341 length:225 start_codon:yes stop_codon:yes gene_type:complete